MNQDSVYIALRVAICCTVFACFVFPPLKSRFRYDYLRTGLLVSLLIAITVIVTILFLSSDSYFSEYSSWGILLWISAAVLVFCIAIRGSFYEILFLVLVVLNLYVNIMMLAKVLMESLDLGLSPSAEEALISTGILILYVPLLWILMIKTYKQIVEIPLRLPFWRYIWLIPALTYMMFYVKMIGDYWSTDLPVGNGDIVFILLWSLGTYIFFWLTLQTLLQAYKGVTAAEQAKLISSQLRMQEERYDSLLKNLEQTSRLRHDWRHHLLSLNGFAESGKAEELSAYLRELLPEYSAEQETPVCRNHVVDVIIRHYAAVAKEQGILMQIEMDFPKTVRCSHSDLCIIFGNLVENAVEACTARSEEPRTIEIKTHIQGEQLVVLIKNTYAQAVRCCGGEYYSVKHEGVGLGLSSVKRVVEKYRGVMNIHYDETHFSVYILLNAAVPFIQPSQAD